MWRGCLRFQNRLSTEASQVLRFKRCETQPSDIHPNGRIRICCQMVDATKSTSEQLRALGQAPFLPGFCFLWGGHADVSCSSLALLPVLSLLLCACCAAHHQGGVLVDTCSPPLADCGSFYPPTGEALADVLLRLLFQRSLQARKWRLSKLHAKRINVTLRRRILAVRDLLYTCTKLGAPSAAAGSAIQPCWAIRPRGRREKTYSLLSCASIMSVCPAKESSEMRLPIVTDWRVVAERRRPIPCHDLRLPDKLNMCYYQSRPRLEAREVPHSQIGR